MMSWGDWLLVSFLGALGAGLLVTAVTFIIDVYVGQVRSVVLANGPAWRVTCGRRTAYIEAVGLRVYGSVRGVDVELEGQRPYAKDPAGTQRQGDTVRMEPGSVMDFGPTEGVIAALTRYKIDVPGAIITVRPFVRVLGRRRPRRGRRRCQFDWSRGDVVREG